MSLLTPFNRFNTRAPLFKEFDALFNSFNRPSLYWQLEDQAPWAPAADVLETEGAIEVKLDLPGVKADDIDVKLEGDTLTLRAKRESTHQQSQGNSLRRERQTGVFARSFVLPQTVDGARLEAHYDSGVLTVTVPKREEAKPRSIQVKVKG